MEILIIPLLIVILPIVVVIIIRSLQRNRLLDNEWRQLSQELGLTFKELSSGDRKMIGSYRRYEVAVYSINKKRFVHPLNDPLLWFIDLAFPRRSRRVEVLLEYPLDNAEVFVAPETGITKAGKMISGDDIRVGDESFDNHFHIRSKPDSLARRAFFNQDIRRRTLEAGRPEISFDGKKLSWMTEGGLMDSGYIRRSVDLVCDIADAITKARPSIISS